MVIDLMIILKQYFLEKLIEELELTVTNLIDLSIDAICLLFYMLWQSADSGWISWNADAVYSWYNISWEVSTLTLTFLIFICSPTFRENFFKFYKSLFCRCNKKLLRIYKKIYENL